MKLFAFIILLGVCHGQFLRTNPLQKAIDALQMDAYDGVSIPLPLYGGSTVNVGVVNLPLDVLCQEKNGIIATMTCHLCYYDCLSVHNTYGGQCGFVNNPPTEGETIKCICKEQPFANGTIPTPVQQCGTMLDPWSDALLDPAFNTAMVGREFAALCTAGMDVGGCADDCSLNHQYTTGSCVSALSVPKYPGDLQVTKNFCIGN